MESWAYLHYALALEALDAPEHLEDQDQGTDQVTDRATGQLNRITSGRMLLGAIALGVLSWPLLAEGAQAYNSLRFGDRGLAVQNLQQLLKGAGLEVPITAEFDSATELALRNYQRRTGKLTPTGVLDRTSTMMLMAANGAPARQTPAPYLVRGDQGPSVQVLQWRLRQASTFNLPLLVTGTFDEATRTALLTYQAQHRLPGTGVLDLETQAKLDAETVEPRNPWRSDGRGDTGNTNDRGNQPGGWQPVINRPRPVAPVVLPPSARPSSEVNTGSYGTLTAPIYGGETSDRVATLQGKLRTLGFQKSRTNTGHFGKVTQTALVAFQRSRRIPATGYVDATTVNALATVPVSGRRGSPYLPVKRHVRRARNWVRPATDSSWQPVYNPCCVRICGSGYGGWQ
ncbi:peptidoglycan-binding protein [Limnothrix sp. FACHB-708]|uniref:peptidoglycan-binding domain-containing protein n=1 Tax=unclassified Limnothrix TaxID=2632864 RepID=UPI0016830D14|nr:MULTISPECIES: peptidoglycan-binding protein [unclassified Limnothrix]MBD2553912.1 peptidoglycan-binding protein [Limnothrix sp. FACHB-708]MBD2590934.1 peptidoglycan-binding protein [Limnothrix sp. FACHB-406]